MPKKIFNSFCIAGTDSGVGKTVITLGLIRALTERSFSVQPFKCGPDYIDSEFHTKAAASSSANCMLEQEFCSQDLSLNRTGNSKVNKSSWVSYNLDTWMMGEKQVKATYVRKVQDADCAVIEGVMGLFDGAGLNSLSGSTASVADLLNVPIILVVNAKNIAQSIAAMVKGYNSLYPQINISGVIANNVGSEHHKKLLQDVLKMHNLPPLIGAIPQNKTFELSERHLGLTPDFEAGKTDEWYSAVAKIVEENINIDLLLKISEKKKTEFNNDINDKVTPEIRLGIAEDEAFHFYYKDNLDLLEKNGFELVSFSPLHDKKLPDNLDAVYFGGGFPEMFIDKLSSNLTMKESIKDFAENNGVIFAECGGYMYLVDRFINLHGETYSMCGILDGIGRMTNELQNFGYKEICVGENCCLGEIGTTVKGHEFHWSTIDFERDDKNLFLVKNINEKECHDAGQCYKNVFGSYIHLHFLSNPVIIKNFRNFIGYSGEKS
jgi:cobyrinic acid a,c-diamide synthase